MGARRRIAGLGLLVVAFWGAVALAAGQPSGRLPNVKGKTFRLPTTIRPETYDVTLRVDPAAGTFEGSGKIAIAVGARTSSLTLHSIGHRFGPASVVVGGRRIAVTSIERNAKSESVTLHLAETIEPGRVRLELGWKGKIQSGLRGLYHADPKLAVTQLEAADARRVFPSFDEPEFKARWAVKVEAPEALTVLANGKRLGTQKLGDGFARTVFATTRPLSSYLLAIGVGDLVSSRMTRAGKTEIRTWTVPGKQHLARYAQRTGRESILALQRYFGRRYPFGKLDQLAVPNFEAGAMENAGLVTYRETALLEDAKTSSVSSRKNIAETITHENAHQWFGNLVTMKWWDDLWLNESFATWMSNKIVDEQHPQFKMWHEFNRAREQAFTLDASSTTHPIHERVKNANEARFDVITYEKGGAVLRMLESWVGAKAFQQGIRGYIKQHAYGNATADDLWRSVQQASNQPILGVANKWIRQKGFPLVQVGRDAAGRITLAQSRFFAEPGKRAAGTWPVPMIVRYEDDAGVHEERILFERSKMTLPPAKGRIKWISANGGATGFYRVAYDRELAAGLAQNVDKLDAAERIGLLSDTLAVARSGRATVGDWLALAGKMRGTKDPDVLRELVRGVATIDKELVGASERGAFQGKVTAMLGPELERLGWGGGSGRRDVESVRLRRATLVALLGRVIKSPRLEAEAAVRVKRFLAGDTGALEPDLRAAAIGLAAASGDAALFDTYADRAANDPDPELKETFTTALAAFEAPALVAKAQAMLFDGKIPQQDTSVFVASLLANPAARGPVWTQMQRDWRGFSKRLEGAPAVLSRVIRAFGNNLPGPVGEAEVRALLQAHTPKDQREVVDQVMDRMRVGLEFRTRAQPQLASWL